VTLRDAREISNPGAPLKDSIFIATTNIESYTTGPAESKSSNGDCELLACCFQCLIGRRSVTAFRTDSDISQKKGVNVRGRELQAWVPSTDAPPVSNGPGGGGDEDTFGPGANGNTPWDQFTANEQLFGVKASFDEDVYTTKLDRSAPDFKDRERRAQRIANEIIGAATSNPHIAEERGLADDSGVNEEDKCVLNLILSILDQRLTKFCFPDMVPWFESQVPMFLLVPAKLLVLPPPHRRPLVKTHLPQLLQTVPTQPVRLRRPMLPKLQSTVRTVHPRLPRLFLLPIRFVVSIIETFKMLNCLITATSRSPSCFP
jgi:hypothetical protein